MDTGGVHVPISRSEVVKIADLARLHFSEEELDEFTAQFQHILDYIEQLRQVDVEAVEPTSHVSLTSDFEKYIFREDEGKPSLPVAESLASAPDSGEGHFRVPKVL
jgi:aspartyl-tRNA(Asn)/glutamyl-tRNA(Gln) amidotransferase subunit C